MEVSRVLPEYVAQIMDVLRAAGHRGYIVGGCLRDILRGVAPHDYDMTTDATPERMLEIFADYRVIPTGLKHGTVTVLCDGHPIEITTHRVDGAYADARRPDSVSFTASLEGDLSRRDFTVNAMAWSPEIGLFDLFGGQEDLRAGILRAVGVAEQRFREDALRILRAFRFSAQLSFEISPDTLAGAAAAAEGLAKISVERIFAELSRLLESPDAERGLAALREAECEPYVFFDTRMAAFLPKINTLPAEAPLRLAAVLPELDEQEAILLARRWHAPNAFGEALRAYLSAVREPLPANPYEARRFVCRYWHHWRGAMELWALRGIDVSAARALCAKVSRDGSAVEVRRLAVKGKELQERLGVRPEMTGKLLLRLQEAVWRESVQNKGPALFAAAEQICQKEREFCE